MRGSTGAFGREEVVSTYRGFRPSLPLGVALLAFLIGLFGFVYLLVGILVVALHVALFFAPAFVGVGVVAGLLLVLLGIVLLVVAFGLWNQELWALVLCILVVGLLFLGYLLGGNLFTLGGLVSLLLLVYLAAVHRHFR